MRKQDSNRPHWHVLTCGPGGRIWFMVGVRMNEKERNAERESGGCRVVRRWFNTHSAAANAKRRLKERGKDVLVFQCPPPEDAFCENGPL